MSATATPTTHGHRPAASTRRDVHLVPADRIHQFVDAYLGGRVEDPADPLETGMPGAYPSLRTRAPWDLPRLLYGRVGIFRRIVDQPADDVWAKGWEIVADDHRLVEASQQWDARVGIEAALTDATRLARRDGWALVRFRLLDNTGDPAAPPQGVRAVLRAEAVPRDLVARVEYGWEVGEPPEGPFYDEPAYYHIRTQTPRDDARVMGGAPAHTASPPREARYHRSRVMFVAQHRKLGARWDGDSVLGWLAGDAHGFENVKWFGAEGFAQRNVPPLVVTIDKEVPVDPDNADDVARVKALDDNVAKLQRGAVQKIRIQGATIQALPGADRINPPDPYARMFLESIAGGSGIPHRELTGSAAGELAAASWDTKRYFGRIATDQRRFATPILRDWYGRLDEWGLVPGLARGLRDVHWYAHIEATEQEQASILNQTVAALDRLAGLQLDGQPFPVPGEVTKLLTFPEGTDLSRGVTRAPGAPSPFASPFAMERRRTPRRAPPPLYEVTIRPDGTSRTRAVGDARIEVSPKLRKVEERYERRVRAEVVAWRKQVLRIVDAAAGDARPRGRFLGARGRDAPTPPDVERAALSLILDPEGLDEIVTDLLTEAAELGRLKTWEELGQSGELQDFLDTPEAKKLSAKARGWSREKAEKVTTRVRAVVAENIARGGSIRELRDELVDAFDHVGNEAAVARNESMRGYNEGSRASMREAGVRSWTHRAYEGACATCQSLDGQVFGLDDPMPPDNAHPLCRCYPEPNVEDA